MNDVSSRDLKCVLRARMDNALLQASPNFVAYKKQRRLIKSSTS